MRVTGRLWDWTLRWVLRPLAQGCASFGGLGVHVPPMPHQDWDGGWFVSASPRRRQRLDRPPARHPERLQPDLPLSETELRIEQELLHLAPILPRERR